MKLEIGRSLGLALSVAVMSALCGCIRTLCEVQSTCGEGPRLNEIVRNEACDGFKVSQIQEDGRLMVKHDGLQHYEINRDTGIRADTFKESFLELRVKPLVDDYVDGQPLKTGYYRFVGVYEYQNLLNKKRRIRDYVEVPEGSK